MVIPYRHFGTTYRSHHQGSKIQEEISPPPPIKIIIDSWHLKMGPDRCPETSVRNYYYYTLRKSSVERGSQKNSLFFQAVVGFELQIIGQTFPPTSCKIVCSFMFVWTCVIDIIIRTTKKMEQWQFIHNFNQLGSIAGVLYHSLVLLRMGETIARNMLSWLKLWINCHCSIFLVVYIIIIICYRVITRRHNSESLSALFDILQFLLSAVFPPLI